ncbi:MAG TPA: DUF4249 domain-containing protein [Bacteroidia bacterium]|nr:DUF4249 domain-containing protein [Bacteroidia bacterium]
MEILRINKFIHIGIILILVSLMSSCEKEANVKIPEVEPKPVLVCFISPEDTVIRVQLTNSIPLYTSGSSEYPYEIKNAEVLISNGSMSKVIPWFKDSLGYQLSTKDFPIKPGETYSLSIKIPDGRKLYAQTTVPVSNFPTFELSIEKNLMDSSEFGVSYEINYFLKWTDIPNATNFYRSVIYNLYHDTALGSDTTALLINELFESDNGKDGSEIKISGQGFYYYVPDSTTQYSGNNYLAYLMLSNKDYFDYHKDLYTNNDDNPFSEAKINYTNIEGGIGCFSAYRLVRKRF